MGLENNKLLIDGVEYKFVVNQSKLETLETAGKKPIMNLLRDASLMNLKMMFSMFIDVDRDKQKVYEKALEEHGFGGLYKFLTEQIEEQAGFLFR